MRDPLLHVADGGVQPVYLALVSFAVSDLRGNRKGNDRQQNDEKGNGGNDSHDASPVYYLAQCSQT